MDDDDKLTADLVLEGGGVKGIGLAGAISALNDHRYQFHRVAGSSAGAIVAALVAAGLAGDALRENTFKVDYRKFRDTEPWGRIPFIGRSLGLLRKDGVYKGDYARDWLAGMLRDLGIHTFGDLRLDDGDIPPDQRYKLVVTVTDITKGLLVRLPWDYRNVYGLDPDEQPVADAVRASMSIPFFFRPARLAGQPSKLLDGGVMSNYPIDTFDRSDQRPPRWPTFGVKLLPPVTESAGKRFPILGSRRPLLPPMRLLTAMIGTMMVGHDQAQLAKPSVAARTIRVRTESVEVTNFSLTRAQQLRLYDEGYTAATEFLRNWRWDDYLTQYRMPALATSGVR